MGEHVRVFRVVACVAALGACGFPRPADVGDSGTVDSPGCVAGSALRCDGNDLVSCNKDGTSEVSNPCPLGCNAADLRCQDMAASNGLTSALDISGAEPDYDFGATATINTDNGTVIVDGTPVAVRSALVAQTSGPTILVFLVHSLTAHDVTITGANALAVVSGGDIQIGGVFATSGFGLAPVPGRFNDGTCRGADGTSVGAAFAGGGGGGFGTAGGRGGSASSDDGSRTGGAAGTPTGNATLVPLRGGCDGGGASGSTTPGAGGGAIQLVSRTKISVTGVVAANGTAGAPAGGGSGGGVLLEAPEIVVTGSVVANGGGGASGCTFSGVGEDGHLDASPARGGVGCPPIAGDGGNGAAGTLVAGDGAMITVTGSRAAFGGSGGGGVGRIRVNATQNGFHRAGVFSPTPSTGVLGVR